jgi:hypothetical protein
MNLHTELIELKQRETHFDAAIEAAKRHDDAGFRQAMDAFWQSKGRECGLKSGSRTDHE